MFPFVLLTLEVVFLSAFDRKIYGTYYTPTIFLAIPYYLILLLSLCTNNYLDFYHLYFPSIYVWCIGLLLFWITGFIMSATILKKTIVEKHPFKFSITPNIEKIILFLSIITAIISNIRLFRGYRIFGELGGEEFEAYLGSGLTAHIAILLRFLSVFSFICISFSKEEKIRILCHLFVIISALLFCIAYTTKSSLLITLLSGIIARLAIRNKKIKIKWIFPTIILSFLVFFISYSLVFGYAAPLEFIVHHTLFYLTTGISGLSYYIQHGLSTGISLEMLFMPIINLYNKLSGQPTQDVISQLWTPVGIGQASNVKTFFGTIYIYGGFWGGIFTTLVWSLLCHLLFILSLKKNIFFFITYIIFLTSLLFGWFDLYFNTVAFYEFLLYGLFFGCIYSLRKYFE